MQPRQSRETLRPVEPRRTYSMGRLLLGREVEIHGLDAQPAGAGEAVGDEAHAAEEAGAEALHIGRHLDRGVLVEPAAGLDVDGFAGGQVLLEHVAIAVQPEDPLAATGGEPVDEEPGAPEQHGPDALHPLEAVVDTLGGGEELVLSDVDLMARAEMEGEDVARPVARQGNLPG